MKNKLFAALVLAFLSTLNPQLSTAFAQGTAFTYQGQLNAAASPANGSYDFTFALFSEDTERGQIGDAINKPATSVTNGLFTVTLDFGADAFDGTARWLEIGVRPGGSANAYEILTPRQPLTATPYAAYAITAGTISPAGTVADTALSPNVARRAGGNTFTGDQVFTNGSVRIQVGPTTVQVNPDGTVAITSTTNITFNTTGDISLAGRDVSLNATRNLSINASTTGFTNAGSLNIKGATTTVQADGTLNLKGSLINLN